MGQSTAKVVCFTPIIFFFCSGFTLKRKHLVIFGLKNFNNFRTEEEEAQIEEESLKRRAELKEKLEKESLKKLLKKKENKFVNCF